MDHRASHNCHRVSLLGVVDLRLEPRCQVPGLMLCPGRNSERGTEVVTAGGAVWWAVLATGEARSQQGLEGWGALESEPEASGRASDGQMVNSGAEIHERVPSGQTRVFCPNACTMGSVWDSVQPLPCSGCLQHLGQLPTHGGSQDSLLSPESRSAQDSVCNDLSHNPDL